MESSSSVSLGLRVPPVARRSPRTAATGRDGRGVVGSAGWGEVGVRLSLVVSVIGSVVFGGG